MLHSFSPFAGIILQSWKMDDSAQCISNHGLRNREQLNNQKVSNWQFRIQNIFKDIVFRSFSYPRHL